MNENSRAALEALIDKTIARLREEIDRINHAIETLMTVQQLRAAHGTHRGRKHMSPEERAAVSARMRRYWDKKRKNQ